MIGRMPTAWGGSGPVSATTNPNVPPTILPSEASDAAAVIWTKPDDWDIAVELKAQNLFSHHPDGTNFPFADGSVQFVKKTITSKVLRALTTRNGFEQVNAEHPDADDR
jgi:hypothetical protein